MKLAIQQSIKNRALERQIRSDGKRGVDFAGALPQNVVPRVHVEPLDIDKIDAQIDAEKVSRNDSKIMRKWIHNEREF